MKKILATGAMIAYITWFNSTTALAASMPEIVATDIQGPRHHESARREKNAEAKVARLAEKLGLDADVLQKDLASNLSIKDILKKYGITKNQLREVLHNRHR